MSTEHALTITTVVTFTLLALWWQILSAWAGEHDADADPEQEGEA